MINSHLPKDRADPEALHALADLPALEPPAALWSAIRADLDQRRRARRQRLHGWIGSALAASLLVGVILAPPDLNPDRPPPAEAFATPDEQPGLNQARQLSALLESGLRERHWRPLNAASVERLVWLESELGWLDARLHDQPGSLDLWRQRIELLGEMNRLYADKYWQADVLNTSL